MFVCPWQNYKTFCKVKDAASSNDLQVNTIDLLHKSKVGKT